MNPIFKWMGIVLAVGIALMVIEYRFAKKKKEGVTPTDKQRVVGTDPRQVKLLQLEVFVADLDDRARFGHADSPATH